MIIPYVRYRAVGGGFKQNELILEFPTKSMPSDFRARGESALVERPPHPDPLPPLGGEGAERFRARLYLWSYGASPAMTTKKWFNTTGRPIISAAPRAAARPLLSGQRPWR